MKKTLRIMTLVDPESVEDYTGDYRRISGDTFSKFFYDHHGFERVFVVDCRTRGEYDGGHIKGATRCHPFEKLGNITELYKREYNPNTLFIFHCEFSAYRAPASIREFIRAHTDAGRPRDQLHAFVLDGGFSQFFAPHQDCCEGRYVSEAECLR